MYGNNTYPNDFEDRTTTGTQGVYSGYQNIPQQTSSQPPKKKGSAGLAKKLAVAGCIGLCFGIFAGTGFYAVSSLTGMLDGKTKQAAESQTQQVLPAAGTAITTSNAVTAVTTDVTGVVSKVMPSVVSITNVFTEKSNFF